MTPIMMNNSPTEEFQWTDWLWAILVCVLFLLPGLSYKETTHVPAPAPSITADSNGAHGLQTLNILDSMFWTEGL